jgi:hypothetical protein
MTECPKPHRVENRKLIDSIFEEQGCCLIGLHGQYGACYGEECLHHVKSKGSGGNDERGNLIRTCLHHHQVIHNGKIKKLILYEYLEEFYEILAI